MSPSEIAFLAVGLILGAAVGAAILEGMRARPAPRRQVRVTISPNTVVPRRSATLAEGGLPAQAVPVPGGPEEDAFRDEPSGAGMPDVRPVAAPAWGRPPVRTPVPSGAAGLPVPAVGVPVHGDAAVAVGPGTAAAGGIAGGGPGPREDVGTRAVSVAATGTERRPRDSSPAIGLLEPLREAVTDPVPAAITVGAHVDTPVRTRPPVADARPTLAAGAVALPVAAAGRDPGTATEGPGPDPGAGADAGADRCGAARQLVDERCALAAAARERARTAADGLREAQRAYDTLREHVDRAERVADPRELAAAKDELHRRFRAASEIAAGAEDAEAAARAWLDAINEHNARAREAARFLEQGRAELQNAAPRIERLSLDADAARIAAESADAGCHEARERLAACEEALAYAAHTTLDTAVEEPHPFDALWPGESDATRTQPRMGTVAPGALALEGQPAVIRILRGDRDARERLAARLAAGDGEPVHTWQLRIAALVDAIVARAIEDGYLDLPDDHAFWGLFARDERREIVGALAALGYRFDGMRGFADGRVPTPRDLTLAVGYAGLDRMRIRAWPRDADAAALLEQAAVAADEWLVAQADDLSLGQMVDALGPRAGDLADTWNAWGRVRPALLSID